MAKLELTPITSLGNTSSAIAAINNNSDAIEDALENTLSRDGTLPNQMEADFDMNSNDILNVGTLQTDVVILNGEQLLPSAIAAQMFLQAGPNAVPRTMQDKVREVVSPSDFSGAAVSGPYVFVGQGDPTFESGINVVLNPNINSVSGGHSNVIGGGGRATFPNLMINSSDLTDLKSYRVIGGGYDNKITGSMASTIAGGAHHRINEPNNAATDHNTISGGSFGTISRGRYSTIGGGTQNSIDGDTATISGGTGNIVSGNFDNATIGGGFQNVASNQHATVVGGYLNTASGEGSTAGGKVNTASGGKSVCIGGEGNTSGGLAAITLGGEQNVINATASRADYGAILGSFQSTIGATAQARFAGVLSGRQNSINSEYGATLGGRECQIPAGCEASVAKGYGAKTPTASASTQAGGYFSAAGDAQSSVIVARRQTTDATPTELRVNSTLGARILMPVDTTWAFSILVVARRADADNESAAYKIEGCIDRQAALVALVGTPVVTVLAEDSAAWDVAVAADTTNSALQINVTGEVGKTIRWVARVTLVEVTG